MASFPTLVTVQYGESRFRYLGESGISNLVIQDRWGEEITVRLEDVIAFVDSYRMAKGQKP